MQRVWQLAMLVGLLMRWVRSQGRQLELLCCLEEAARRRHLVRLGKLLVLRVAHRRRRLRLWVPPWSVVVRRCRRWERRQQRLLVVQVRVHWRLRWRLARLLVRRWTFTVDRRRRRAVRRQRRP